MPKADLKQVRAVALELGMTLTEEQEFGRWVEDEKAAGRWEGVNPHGKLSYAQLLSGGRDFLEDFRGLNG
jgi:hypothetical protein